MPDQILELADGTRIAVRRSRRARRMVLRVGRMDGKAVLTLPAGASLGQARGFADAQSAWLARQQAAAPGIRTVAAGARFPLAGIEVIITPHPELRTARREGGLLLVPAGRPAGAVTAAYLRIQARAALMPRVTHHIAGLGPGARAFAGMQLRDTSSRWGSCSSQGRLMFSWRLAMAPPQVLDYVAAHEVAHLRHMDHSPAFWTLVARLMPDYQEHRRWLRKHGPALMAWRFAAPAAAAVTAHDRGTGDDLTH